MVHANRPSDCPRSSAGLLVSATYAPTNSRNPQFCKFRLAIIHFRGSSGRIKAEIPHDDDFATRLFFGVTFDFLQPVFGGYHCPPVRLSAESLDASDTAFASFVGKSRRRSRPAVEY